MSKKRNTAIVSAKVYLDGVRFPAPIVEKETSMTDDLPADNLGELLCDAVQAAWKAGHDPVTFSVVISFR